MRIKRLVVDAQLMEHPEVSRIAKALNLVPEPVEDQNLVFELIKNDPDPWEKGKRILWLRQNKAVFFKKCPGTREYLCCGYQILHFGSYCTMDCAYCILQTYFHPPVLQYFVNHESLFDELETVFAQKKCMRIGTGEFTDSLIWEPWTDLTPSLVNTFSTQKHAVLELKTKSTAIERLLKPIKHERKTILSWSLNTPRVIQTQERGTASLEARLRAAARAEKSGYPLAFHFDPMILYPGCDEEYHRVVDALFKAVSAENIVWISLGTFRFMPALEPIIKKRFPDSDIVYGEFIPGLDGKMRYFKPLRIDLYRRMVSWIQCRAPELLVYLCMEDEAVWQQSFGFSPKNSDELANMLDNSARKHCDLQ